MHNRVIGTYFYTALAFLLSCLLWSQPAMAGTNDCSTGNIWRGYLYNEENDEWTEYMPEDFFIDSIGAKLPDYDTENPKLHPYFTMKDTTCSSYNWSIRFTGYSHLSSWGETQAIIEIDVIGFTKDPSLAQIDGKPQAPIRFQVKDTCDSKHKPIKGLKAGLSKYEMGFDYHDDTLYFYRNGYIYQKEAYHICKIVNPAAYWSKFGGWLESIDYWDYANGAEYHETFNDCSNVQTFPECEPQPEVTLEAFFDLPDCSDSTLYLSAISNLLVDFHWEGPNGWTSDEQNPKISYKDAASGKYLVWGKLDPCSDAAYVILDINIPKLKKDTNYQVSTCHGDTVRIGDHLYTESGTYIDTLKTAAGCDSVVYTVLDFHYKQSTSTETICTGSTYDFHGKQLSEEGTYTDTVKVEGCNCDSIVTLILETFTITNEVYDTICEGRSYEFGNKYIGQSGDYTHTFKTPNGCDSTVTLHLHTYTITNEVYETICEGSAYEFGGQFIEKAGDYVHKFETPEGCDSTVTLHLHTFLITNDVYDTICEGSTYEFGDLVIEKAGDYVHKFKTPDGCDSVVTLHLTTYLITSEVHETICEGGTYLFGDQILDKAGDYVRKIKTAEGCDSVVTLHLHTYLITNDVYDTICEGRTYEFGDLTIEKAGKYTYTFKTPEGCDSTVTLHLSTYKITGVAYDTICEGSTYEFGDLTIEKAGKYTYTFKTPEGCDSTVTLHLSTYAIKNTDTVTICKGSSYLFGDTLLSKAGVYVRKFKTPDGCDSTVTLRLNVEEIHSIETESICEGSTYLFGDTLLSKAGNYKRTFKTPDGCDSTVYLRLTTYTISATIYDTICKGQEYHFNDTICTKSGTYKYVSKTAGGCDSTTILRLTVTRPGAPTVIPINVCKGDSLMYNGHIFNKLGTFRDTLSDRAGCDSIIVYKVDYGYQHDTSFVYRTCADNPIQVINGEWINKDTSFTTLMEFDNYECKVKTRIVVFAAPSVHSDDTTFHLCGKHQLRVHLDSFPMTKFQWEPVTGVACPTCSNTDVSFTGDAASYRVMLNNGYCQDTINVEIETTPNPIIIAAGVNQEGENLVVLVKDGTEPYYYQIDSLGDWHNNSTDFDKLDIGVHTAYVKDDKGCIAKKRFSYYVPVIPAKVMTDNGDGIRDRWEIKNLELYNEYTVEIYNRWGKRLKYYHNNYDGWDGTYNGHKMPSTDYWYRIVVQLNDQEITGHFTLIRF